MSKLIRSILIVGGGTAGWITAAILAAKHGASCARPLESPLRIRLIEAPNIPIIGVGEGTWPSMRSTLRRVGIQESEFLKECQASFKQGSKFVGWKNGTTEDYYYHPFELPHDFLEGNLAQHWLDHQSDLSFSKFVCAQESICEQDLSPKLRSSGDYAGVLNYGYHLNAGKFSEFMKRHCLEKLGVELVLDKVIGVVSSSDGDISHVQTETSGNLSADLFIDCTGFKALLLGEHLGVKFIDKSHAFPINSALAAQIPYNVDEAIKSVTVSTAQEAGWIWDIGLSSRRGVGYVYSDNHLSKDSATRQLQSYLGMTDTQFADINLRNITIKPGHRETFWHKNCVAVGLSAGFLEPLEASAIMLIEVSANMIADQMPINRAAMETVAKRFNRRTSYRWARIIDFLKLHYALSERSESFWRDSACKSSWSDRLKEDLDLWQHHAPWVVDFDHLDEVFPIASYQYVLYGMGYKTTSVHRASNRHFAEFCQQSISNVERASKLLLPKVESNRSILALINGAP